jgi:hypothetical protein
MGSNMGDDFRAYKEHKREQRAKRKDANLEKLVQLKIPAVQQSSGTYRIETPVGVVMYYPSTNKWQHKTRVYYGDITAMHGWLKKQRML